MLKCWSLSARAAGPPRAARRDCLQVELPRPGSVPHRRSRVRGDLVPDVGVMAVVPMTWWFRPGRPLPPPRTAVCHGTGAPPAHDGVHAARGARGVVQYKNAAARRRPPRQAPNPSRSPRPGARVGFPRDVDPGNQFMSTLWPPPRRAPWAERMALENHPSQYWSTPSSPRSSGSTLDGERVRPETGPAPIVSTGSGPRSAGPLNDSEGGRAGVAGVGRAGVWCRALAFRLAEARVATNAHRSPIAAVAGEHPPFVAVAGAPQMPAGRCRSSLSQSCCRARGAHRAAHRCRFVAKTARRAWCGGRPAR